jgi:hypothetical protein
MENFLDITLIGIIASLIIEGINRLWQFDSLKAKVATIVVSIVLGAFYFFMRNSNVWQDIIGILTTASAIYAFFLKQKK